MSKFTEMLGRKKSEKKEAAERTPEVLQAEYNNTCAMLGQDVVRVADLVQATEQLTKNIEEHKRKIFLILREIPEAQKKAKEKADKEAVAKGEVHAQSNP